jgi:hypothetical protein
MLRRGAVARLDSRNAVDLDELAADRETCQVLGHAANDDDLVAEPPELDRQYAGGWRRCVGDPGMVIVQANEEMCQRHLQIVWRGGSRGLGQCRRQYGGPVDVSVFEVGIEHRQRSPGG